MSAPSQNGGQARRRTTPRATEPQLSRGAIIRAALGVVDGEGLDALTMRRLADAAGAKPMSLYRHVSNKAEILDAIAEAVLEEVELPEAGGGLEQALGALRSFRAALLAHPNTLPLFAGPGSARGTRQQFTLLEAALEAGAALGLSDRDSLRGYAVTLAYVIGFVMREVSSPTTVALDGTSDRAWLALIDGFGADLPRLRAATRSLPAREDLDELFDFGLETLLVGLTRRNAG